MPSKGPLFTPLTLSAASEASLRSLIASYIEYLEQHPETSLRDFAYTLQERRSTLGHRAFIPAPASTQEAIDKLRDLITVDSEQSVAELGTKHFKVATPRILGVFTGQGAQWPRMGAKLVESSPFVSARLDELDKALQSLPTAADRPKWSLREQLLAGPETSKISEAALSQPLCTAVQIVLVDLLKVAGIQLTAVVGHSSGMWFPHFCPYITGLIQDALLTPALPCLLE